MDNNNVFKDDHKSLELERAGLIVRFSGVGGISKELLPSFHQDRYVELNQILDKPKKVTARSGIYKTCRL